MSEVINFKTKIKDTSMDASIKSDELVKEILELLLNEIDNISDIIVFTKYNNGEFILSHSGPTLADKALTVQLLQHDINSDISYMAGDTLECPPES